MTKQVTQQVAEILDTRLSDHISQLTSEEPDGLRISEVIDGFIRNQRDQWKAISGMEKSYREVFFPLLIEIIGDLPTNKITKSHILDFTYVMLVYPSNRNKKKNYQHMNARDFLANPPPEKDRIKPNTKRKYFVRIGAFLRWLKTGDLTSIDLSAPINPYGLG